MKTLTHSHRLVVRSPGPSAGGATDDRHGRKPGFTGPRGLSPRGATESNRSPVLVSLRLEPSGREESVHRFLWVRALPRRRCRTRRVGRMLFAGFPLRGFAAWRLCSCCLCRNGTEGKSRNGAGREIRLSPRLKLDPAGEGTHGGRRGHCLWCLAPEARRRAIGEVNVGKAIWMARNGANLAQRRGGAENASPATLRGLRGFA